MPILRVVTRIIPSDSPEGAFEPASFDQIVDGDVGEIKVFSVTDPHSGKEYRVERIKYVQNAGPGESIHGINEAFAERIRNIPGFEKLTADDAPVNPCDTSFQLTVPRVLPSDESERKNSDPFKISVVKNLHCKTGKSKPKKSSKLNLMLNECKEAKTSDNMTASKFLPEPKALAKPKNPTRLSKKSKKSAWRNKKFSNNLIAKKKLTKSLNRSPNKHFPSIIDSQIDNCPSTSYAKAAKDNDTRKKLDVKQLQDQPEDVAINIPIITDADNEKKRNEITFGKDENKVDFSVDDSLDAECGDLVIIVPESTEESESDSVDKSVFLKAASNPTKFNNNSNSDESSLGDSVSYLSNGGKRFVRKPAYDIVNIDDKIGFLVITEEIVGDSIDKSAGSKAASNPTKVSNGSNSDEASPGNSASNLSDGGKSSARKIFNDIVSIEEEREDLVISVPEPTEESESGSIDKSPCSETASNPAKVNNSSNSDESSQGDTASNLPDGGKGSVVKTLGKEENKVDFSVDDSLDAECGDLVIIVPEPTEESESDSVDESACSKTVSNPTKVINNSNSGESSQGYSVSNLSDGGKGSVHKTVYGIVNIDEESEDLVIIEPAEEIVSDSIHKSASSKTASNPTKVSNSSNNDEASLGDSASNLSYGGKDSVRKTVYDIVNIDEESGDLVIVVPEPDEESEGDSIDKPACSKTAINPTKVNNSSNSNEASLGDSASNLSDGGKGFIRKTLYDIVNIDEGSGDLVIIVPEPTEEIESGSIDKSACSETASNPTKVNIRSSNDESSQGDNASNLSDDGKISVHETVYDIEDGHCAYKLLVALRKYFVKGECLICGFISDNKDFNGVEHMNSHTLTNSFASSYKCSCCDAEFTSPENLYKHALAREKSYKYRCSICHLPFKRKLYLARHISKCH